MLNRRQFIYALVGSLSALSAPFKLKESSAKPKIIDFDINSLNIDIVIEKLEQGFILLLPYNKNPSTSLQNISTPIPILTSITDTHDLSLASSTEKVKTWQLSHVKFQADDSKYQVWKINSLLSSQSQVTQSIITQHWNLWSMSNEKNFSKLGTILLTDTGDDVAVQNIYEQVAGLLVPPAVEVYSYKGNLQTSLTAFNRIASPFKYVPI